METDEPTQPYSAYVPRNEGGGENYFAVPPIAKMSQGPGPSAPAASASSVGNMSSQAPTKTYSAAPSSSANRGAGQSKPVPSSHIVPSRGARTPLPDMEEIDMEMAPVRAAGKRPSLPGQKAQAQWGTDIGRSTTHRAPVVSNQTPSFLAFLGRPVTEHGRSVYLMAGAENLPRWQKRGRLLVTRRTQHPVPSLESTRGRGKRDLLSG